MFLKKKLLGIKSKEILSETNFDNRAQKKFLIVATAQELSPISHLSSMSQSKSNANLNQIKVRMTKRNFI